MSLLKRLALTVVLTAALMNVMPVLSLLERVPPQVLVFAALLLLAVGAFRALAILWRVRSDNRAAAVTQAQRPRRMPSNLATRMWDFDEHGRSYW